MNDAASEWPDRLSAALHALADAKSHFSNEREIALLRRRVEELTEEGQRRGFTPAAKTPWWWVEAFGGFLVGVCGLSAPTGLQVPSPVVSRPIAEELGHFLGVRPHEHDRGCQVELADLEHAGPKARVGVVIDVDEVADEPAVLFAIGHPTSMPL